MLRGTPAVKIRGIIANFQQFLMTGAPNTIRTCDPRLRRAVLYPAELWALCDFVVGINMATIAHFNVLPV